MDTSDVTRVYMARPQSLASIGLGQWFCKALGLNDKELIYSEGAQAKRLLVQKNLLEIPGLIDILKGYNRQFVEK